MSVGLYKYDGNIFDDAEEVLSENVASQRMYDKYLQPAIKELSIFYFQDGSEIRKANLNLVLDEIELLIKWVMSHMEGDDKEYLLSRLKNVEEIIPKLLENDEDILYIF